LNIFQNSDRKDTRVVGENSVFTANRANRRNKGMVERRSLILVIRGGDITGNNMHVRDIDESMILTHLNEGLSDNKCDGTCRVNDLRGRAVHSQFSRGKRIIHAGNSSVIICIPRASGCSSGTRTRNARRFVDTESIATGNAEEACNLARRHEEDAEMKVDTG
jgi:hypothetical protein